MGQSSMNQPGVQNTGVHSLPALLIPEDYRARAVALHARELILRSPQMSAIALGGFSAGFSGGFSNGSNAGFENAGERPPTEGVAAAGSANTASTAGGGLLQDPSPSARSSKTPWTRQSAPSTADAGGMLGGTRAQKERAQTELM